MYPDQDPVTARAQARIGSVLREKWRLDALLGVGGMAAVYAATHRNNTRGAIKILHAELAVDADVRARFLREGYAANTVGHRGVVRVLDDDVLEDGSVFLVMELLEGESLESRRTRVGGRLAAPDVLSAADQLLDVLIAAHAKGIVHRDLKPDNVFITTDGQVKVLDFGIAKLRQSAGSRATRTGSAMGTPAYMPPEQARGRWELVDARSDIWAVGATMFTLATGRTVHEAATVNEQLLAAMTIPAPSVGAGENLAPQLVALVDRALEYDPAKRWQDAASMQEAVREAYHAIFRSPIASAPKLSTPPPSSLAQAMTEPQPRAMVTTGGAITRGSTGVSLETAASVPRWMWTAVAALGATIIGAGMLAAVVIPSPKPPAGGITAGSSHPDLTSPSGTSAAGPPTAQSAGITAVDVNALPLASALPASSGRVVAPGGQPRSLPDAGRTLAPPAASPLAPPPDDMFEKRR